MGSVVLVSIVCSLTYLIGISRDAVLHEVNEVPIPIFNIFIYGPKKPAYSAAQCFRFRSLQCISCVILIFSLQVNDRLQNGL